MKHIILLLLLTTTINIYSQQGINYKAIITDQGEVLRNKDIDVQFTILEEGNKTVYTENHNAVTDKNGIIILNIGEGNVTDGDFSEIDWSKEQFLKVEIDLGENYLDFGITAFKAVPYAKYADKAANVFSGKFQDLKDIPQGLSDGDNDTHITEEKVDEYVENNGYLTEEIDGSTENELQVLTLKDNQLELSHGGGVIILPEGKDNWGNQAVKSDITLTGIGTEENPLGVVGDLTDNQSISNVSLSSDSLTIGIENGNSQTVDLSPLKDGIGTDNQNISGSELNGSILTIGIENGNSQTVDLSPLKDGTGTDNQNISGSELNGSILTIGIENGNPQTIDLSPLKDGTGTDNQNISGSELNGSILTIGIENGNSQTVDLSSLQDSNVTKIDDLDDAKSTNNDFSLYLGKSAGHNDSISKYNLGVGSNSLHNVKEGIANVALGYKSLYKNIEGDNNIAIGHLALYENGNGEFEAHNASNNIAIGDQSLESNTSGYNNIGIGSRCLQINDSGYFNTAIGSNSLENNIEGNFNTALGFRTLNNNLTGNNNIAIGVNALLSNTASNNTAIGVASLTSNITGTENTALGHRSLYRNESGNNNIAIGNSALLNNTVKGNLIAIGDSALYNNGINSNNTYYSTRNVAIGSKSLFANTVGSRNTAIGFNSLKTNISGVSNTAIGASALYLNSIGGQNTSIGEKAMYENKIGFRSTAIGYRAGYKSTGNGCIFIGNKAGYNETGNNKLYINNTDSSTPLIGGDFARNTVVVNGKLGIGVSSPAAKLHIDGDVKVNTTLKTGSDIYSGGSVKVNNDFKYLSPKTYYYQVHPLDFKIAYGDGGELKQDETTMWIGHDNGYSTEWYSGRAYAQIRLPHGARIKKVRYYYKIINAGGGTASFSIALFRKNITTSSGIEIMEQKDHLSPTGNVYVPYYLDNISNTIIDNYNYQYILKVFLDEIAQSNENTDNVSFYGATIEYTIVKVGN